VQQFFAAFALGPHEGGFNRFTLVESRSDAAQERVVGVCHVGDANRLTKLTGRLPKDNLFGNMVHAWIYDPVVTVPDRTNRTAWLLDDAPFSRETRDRLINEIWALYQLLSPVPLLDSWRDVVLHATHQECVKLMHTTEHPPIGRCAAVRVRLPEDFSDQISRMVQASMIGIAGEERELLEQLAA
jgi:hypothetical protein